MRQILFLGTIVAILTGCLSEPEGAGKEHATEKSSSVEPAQESPELDPAPTVAGSFLSPWPKGFSRRELADTALAKTHAYFDSRTEGASEGLLTVTFQETVLDVHQEWGSEVAVLTIESFAEYLDGETLLVVGTEGDFFIETLAEKNRPLPPEFDRCCSRGIAGVAYLGTSWVSLPSDFIVEKMPPAGHMAIIPHELFHNIQDSLDKGPASQTYPPGNELYRPVWLTEGSANYMGFAITDYLGHKDYWGNHFVAPSTVALDEDFVLARYEVSDGSNDPYSYGQLATEYIIASVGVEPLMNVWKLSGEGLSFEESFEQAIGISVEEFYAAYDEMISSMVFE